MHTLQHSCQGLGLLFRLNWDRAVSALAILSALLAAAWIGGM
ncbi:hypothetical protein ACUXV3_03995 [Roseobacteraceae bacterium NS-SX3]